MGAYNEVSTCVEVTDVLLGDGRRHLDAEGRNLQGLDFSMFFHIIFVCFGCQGVSIFGDDAFRRLGFLNSWWGTPMVPLEPNRLPSKADFIARLTEKMTETGRTADQMQTMYTQGSSALQFTLVSNADFVSHDIYGLSGTHHSFSYNFWDGN